MEWIIGFIILWILSAIFGGSKDDSSTKEAKFSKTSVRNKPIPTPPCTEINKNSQQQYSPTKPQELAKKHPHLNKGQPQKKIHKQIPREKGQIEINELFDLIDSENKVKNLLKKDWKSIADTLAATKINNLYHFTDMANIQSIKKMGGLYSWKELERLGVNIPAQGGNDLSKRLDNHKKIEDYVRLSFVKNTPMLYLAQRDGRISNSILLKIDPVVILLKDTLYSDGNAIANNAQIGNSVNDFKKIKFHILQKTRWEGDEEKHYWQAEVMVKKFVPLKFIKNLPA